MILAASNIAWHPQERLDVYDLMQASGLTGLEIAPGLFFSKAENPFDPDAASAKLALSEINDRGLKLVSMQSLLFGVQGASLFGDVAQRLAFEQAMNRAIHLAGKFGIPNLVFGSPSQRRIPEGLAYDEAFSHAVEIFFRLGQRAAEAGTVISVETNPSEYGTNFLTRLDEAEHFVAQVGHRAVALILDLGAMHMNQDFDSVIPRLKKLTPWLNHVHVSEPHLAPAPQSSIQLKPVIAELRSCHYSRSVSIEMKRPEEGLVMLKSCFSALTSAAALEDR